MNPKKEHAVQGNPQVIEYFKNLLRGELAARDQYFIHSRIYEDQGLVKMYTRLDHEMQEETQHADALLRRILFLGGMPDMRPNPFTPGTRWWRCCKKTWPWNTKCAMPCKKAWSCARACATT